MADRGRGRGGRGGGRGRGRAGGAGNASGGRVCFEFQKSGQCSRENCRFTHETDDEQLATPETRPARAPETDEQRHARKSYNAWKRYLSLDPNDMRTMQRIWEGAVKILEDGDRDRKQQLPQDLDSDNEHHNGRLHIDAIMRQSLRDGECNKILISCRNFLRTITHRHFVNSLAVDTYVSSIYNYVSGANGSRAMPFFQRMCRAIVTARTANNSGITFDVLDDTLVAMATALREMLKRERRARFNDELEALTKSLETAADLISSGGPSVAAMMVLNHMRAVRDMVARASGLLLDRESTSHTAPLHSEEASSYPRDLILPSDRHDNDKLDMTNIVIFPTRDEIMSDAKDFLPFTDPDQPHYLEDPVQRHIDTHFRLFRHDVFGELKPALAGLMQTFMQDRNAIKKSNIRVGDARAYSYQAAYISQVVFERMLEVRLSFMLPAQIRLKSKAQQRAWWEESRRLAHGCLLSYIWIEGDLVQHVFLTLAQKDVKGGFVPPDGFTTISARLMTQDKATLQMLMRASVTEVPGVMLEFPRIIPATFVPILENLQSMQRLGGIPFQQWVVPARHEGAHDVKVFHDIPAPLYARQAGFAFPMDSITTRSEGSISIKATDSCENEDLLKELETSTTLDRGQCRALLAALTREFAFIQGPPGTGKSYLGLHIMRVLLAIKKKAKLGPILVVCYTNHALDQFLEHLVDVGVTKIIRVGAQSKSQKLANHNLQQLRRTETNTRSEKSQAWNAYHVLDDAKKSANRLLSELHRMHQDAGWHHLKTHLLEDYSEIHHQFKIVDEEGWQLVGYHPFDLWSMTDIMAHAVSPATFHQMTLDVSEIVKKATINVWSLTNAERRKLIAHWVEEIHEAKIGELFEIVGDAAATQNNLDNVHAEASRRILQEADVIGLTTSGLAGRISLLKNVACKVLICEEAGEILEPHMLSASLPSVEHCIQIGDHEQLRPTVSNFTELSMESERGKQHQLDKSQFERLSVGEPSRPLVPVAQLNVQRRMRPEISTLIRETIYDKLTDHTSTADLSDVVGLRNNVYWLDHRHLEDEASMDIQHSKSKSNAWEAEFVHAMVRHVVRQGAYKSSDIAVLTPYTGQLQQLRAALRADFEIVLSDRDEEALEKDGFVNDDNLLEEDHGLSALDHGRKPLEKKQLLDLLRVATVDNFQGEEAKVVIVSLVRSNTRQNVGFLKTSNRINVLLSRAKHGMYLIGNSETYSSVTMWEKIIGMLRTSDSVGQSLGLCCPRHPDKILSVREPDDFAKFSPEGGCRESCADRLDCGHGCEARCHSEAMHAAFKCEQPCEQRHAPCDHPCQKATCGEPCGKCMVEVNNVQLPCGHVLDGVECHKTLAIAELSCHVPVKKHVPGCGHDIVVKCSQDVTITGFRCSSLCETNLPCGHRCPGTCGRCNFKDAKGESVVRHAICKKQCERKLGACNHVCSRSCHDGTDCGLCYQSCEVRCKHSKCPHKCFEPCAPCADKCEWSCEHQGACSMPCSAPCDRLPCDVRCTKALPCGHQCPSICGEYCPVDCCQQCDMRSDEQPDMLEMKSYSDIDLNDTPIIALACGHFFTTESLDGVVGLKDVYEQDPMTGQFIAVSENAQLATTVPQCPSCRQPIRQHVTQRYNRLINKAVIDETSKRFIVSGHQKLQDLAYKLTEVESHLEASRSSIVPVLDLSLYSPEALERAMAHLSTIVSDKLETRYNTARSFDQSCTKFRKKTNSEHEPVNKLHRAIAHASKRSLPIETDFSKLNLSSSDLGATHGGDQRITLGGSLLQIKVQCLVLEDKVSTLSLLRSHYPVHFTPPATIIANLVEQMNSFLNSCIKLLDTCIVAKLPKIAVEATLYYARIVQALGSSGVINNLDRQKMLVYRDIAKERLEAAAGLCQQPFESASALATAVESSLRLLGKEFYQEVTKEELEAIKKAMIRGPGGIATHSGHWYNRVNGHPFAIGECGMPMEQALCPECGEHVGGQNHAAVAGVTRAFEMER